MEEGEECQKKLNLSWDTKGEKPSNCEITKSCFRVFSLAVPEHRTRVNLRWLRVTMKRPFGLGKLRPPELDDQPPSATAVHKRYHAPVTVSWHMAHAHISPLLAVALLILAQTDDQGDEALALKNVRRLFQTHGGRPIWCPCCLVSRNPQYLDILPWDTLAPCAKFLDNYYLYASVFILPPTPLSSAHQ